MPTFKPSPALAPPSDDQVTWRARTYDSDSEDDWSYEVPRPKKWMGFVQGSSIEGEAWLPDPVLTFEEAVTADLEEAEAVAEEVADLDFKDEAWGGGQERDVWVLSPTGRKYHFCVRVEFNPSFSASQYRECPECGGTGLKDAKGVAEEPIQIKCWRCHGQKEIA